MLNNKRARHLLSLTSPSPPLDHHLDVLPRISLRKQQLRNDHLDLLESTIPLSVLTVPTRNVLLGRGFLNQPVSSLEHMLRLREFAIWRSPPLTVDTSLIFLAELFSEIFFFEAA